MDTLPTSETGGARLIFTSSNLVHRKLRPVSLALFRPLDLGRLNRHVQKTDEPANSINQGAHRLMKPDEHNQRAWEKESSGGGSWSSIVPAETMASVRRGEYRISMSPDKRPIPKDWLGPLEEVDLLCLAGGGGQQGPILAGLGANVTVYDFSSNQLGLDRLAAEKYGLEIKTVQGDMRDLSCFPDKSFDIE